MDACAVDVSQVALRDDAGGVRQDRPRTDRVDGHPADDPVEPAGSPGDGGPQPGAGIPELRYGRGPRRGTFLRVVVGVTPLQSLGAGKAAIGELDETPPFAGVAERRGPGPAWQTGDPPAHWLGPEPSTNNAKCHAP